MSFGKFIVVHEQISQSTKLLLAVTDVEILAHRLVKRDVFQCPMSISHGGAKFVGADVCTSIEFPDESALVRVAATRALGCGGIPRDGLFQQAKAFGESTVEIGVT